MNMPERPPKQSAKAPETPRGQVIPFPGASTSTERPSQPLSQEELNDVRQRLLDVMSRISTHETELEHIRVALKGIDARALLPPDVKLTREPLRVRIARKLVDRPRPFLHPTEPIAAEDRKNLLETENDLSTALSALYAERDALEARLPLEEQEDRKKARKELGLVEGEDFDMVFVIPHAKNPYREALLEAGLPLSETTAEAKEMTVNISEEIRRQTEIYAEVKDASGHPLLQSWIQDIRDNQHLNHGGSVQGL